MNFAKNDHDEQMNSTKRIQLLQFMKLQAAKGHLNDKNESNSLETKQRVTNDHNMIN